MTKVIRIGRKRKPKLTVNEKYLTRDLHTKIEMIHALIPIGMIAVAEQLEEKIVYTKLAFHVWNDGYLSFYAIFKHNI